MAEGRSNQAIADRLFVTLRAVEKHVTSIFSKLDLPASTDDHRRVLAVLAADPHVAETAHNSAQFRVPRVRTSSLCSQWVVGRGAPPKFAICRSLSS